MSTLYVKGRSPLKPEGNSNPTDLLPTEVTLLHANVVTAHSVKQVINNPSDQQLFDRELMGEPVLRCPVCGNEFSHVQGVYTLIGGDESDGMYRGSHLVARETPYRRDALAIRVHGETCGHRWDVVLQQHKGNTFIRVDVLHDGGIALPKERRY